MSAKKERREESVAEELLKRVVEDAKAWSIEGGLEPPFNTNVAVLDFGFKVHVDEAKGGGSATCTFLRDGARSMYERDKA